MSTYYFVPSRNVFGEGSVEETGRLMKSVGGTKTMIVTDEFLASHPMTARIQKILIIDDLGTDEAAFKIAVDLSGGSGSLCPFFDGPGPRFLFPCSQITDQSEKLVAGLN